VKLAGALIPGRTEEQEAEMKQAWTDAHGGWRGGDEEV
jgi:hypothetical protein